MSAMSNLKPWYQEDILRLLISIYVASLKNDTRLPTDYEQGVKVGFMHALKSVAVIFGILPDEFEDFVKRGDMYSEND